LSIEYVRAQGPVQPRLYPRFGREMANGLAAMTLAPENEITIGIASNISKRPRNEDSSVALHARSNADHTTIPVTLAAVADGMGGLHDGDEASAITVLWLAETVADTLLDSSQRPDRLSATSIEHLLAGVISEAHAAVIANTEQGGTTLTCALVAGDTATLAHVGDSRAYQLDFVAGEIRQLTHDHTFAYRMAEAGLLTEREAASHPQSHTLYHAIGVNGRCEADIIRCPLTPGSAILLCSDGLWRPVGPDDIYTIVCQADHPQEAAEQLIETAMACGGYDDATAVLVRMPESLPAVYASHEAQEVATVESPLPASLTVPVE